MAAYDMNTVCCYDRDRDVLVFIESLHLSTGRKSPVDSAGIDLFLRSFAIAIAMNKVN